MIGLVIIPIALEATAGGSLRRGILMIGGVAVLSSLGYGLFAASTLNGTAVSEWWAGVMMSVLATILAVPVCILRYLYPSMTIGFALGFATSENTLIGSLTFAHPDSAWDWTARSILAVTVGATGTIIVTHTIMVKGARPTAAGTLATILETMAKVLDPLASMTAVNGPNPFSSSNLLLMSYPQMLASARKLLIGLDLAVPGAPTEDPPTQPDLRKPPEPAKVYSIREALEPTKRDCERMLESMSKCQKMLNAQKDLVTAAAQELSCRRPHRFPRQRYMALLAEVRTLFFHISFLVYATSLYLSSVEYQMKAYDFSSNNAKRFAVPHSKSAPMHRVHSGKLLAPPDVIINAMTSGLSPFCPRATGHQSHHCSVSLGGCDLHKVAEHVVKALNQIAQCLRKRKKTTPEALCEVEEVSVAVESLGRRRKQQREKFADIIFAALEADVTGVWNKRGPLDWRGALGLEAKELRSMSHDEKTMFWETYWLERDQLSATEQTLHTLTDSLIRLCDHVDSYVDVALVPDATVLAVLP